MYTTRNRRARIAGVAALALSGLMLTSCSLLPGGGGPEDAGENVGAAESAASEAKKDFDTGEYDTTFYAPFKEVTSPVLGEVTEGMEIGKNVVLASEMDEDFDRVLGGKYDPKATLELLEGPIFSKYAEKFQSGYRQGGIAPDKRKLSVRVYRFDSPDTAQAVQADWVEEVRTRDSEYRGSFADQPIEALEDTVALMSRPKPVNYDRLDPNAWDFQLSTLSTHNEFYIGVDLDAPQELTDEDVAFVGDYLRALDPLLDAVPTHRTDAGFGRLDNWPDVDPDGVVRYAVVPPDDPDYRSGVPRSLNARTFSAIHGLDYAKTSDAFRAAGVEGAGDWGTTVVQARDEAAAESFRDFLDEQDAANESTSYEEPQGVPGTTCSEYTDGASPDRKIYSCVMVHGRHVAYSSTTENREEEDTAINRTDDSVGDIDPKTLLSQRMAAQYELFEDAEENPDGTPRNQRPAVNEPGEEATAGTESSGR